ncbi:MAG: cytochrome c [Gammaproteobacteria bacterium]|nr:cytochrome c [Gammaproteobacteria bacterium]NND59847.1 cytochrome c [Gammaproteobacteria bacterium]
MTGIFRLTGLLCGLVLCGIAVAEGDPEAGEVKSYTCRGCHGIANYKNVYPTYRVPKLVGQNAEYLVIALKAYRSGERSHPTMQSQAVPMSDQDMEDIAAFFAAKAGDE